MGSPQPHCDRCDGLLVQMDDDERACVSCGARLYESKALPLVTPDRLLV